MTIAYLSTFYPFRGGIAQFNASLLDALSNLQHTVRAYTFKRQYPSLFFPGKSQYVQPTDTLSLEVSSHAVLDTINPLSYYSTARTIGHFSPDLLLMKYWMPFFAPSLGTVSKKMPPHTKVISIMDNVTPHESRFVDKLLTHYFLKHNDGFIVMSDAVERHLQRMLPYPKPILNIKHPSYNHFGKKIHKADALKALGLSPQRKTILFFGLIRAYKGLDLLIDAFSMLHNDAYQLVIAGECYGSFQPYQRQIDASKRKDNIHVYNRYIRDAEVSIFFSAADVCVLPYKSATQSGIMSIAQHFDLPAIVTNKGGLAEAIVPNKTGIVVKDANAVLLSEAISTYFSSNTQAVFSENISQINRENSWEHFGERLINFVEMLHSKAAD